MNFIIRSFKNSCFGARDFYSKTIENLQNLEENWPDWKISDPTQYLKWSLWHYQWRRHGTCVSQLRNQIENCLDYFTETINLGQEYANRLDRKLTEMFSNPFPNSHPTMRFNKAVDFLRTTHHNIDGQIFNITVFWQEKKAGSFIHPGTKKMLPQLESWIESINFCFNLQLEAIDCEPDGRTPRWHTLWDYSLKRPARM